MLCKFLPLGLFSFVMAVVPVQFAQARTGEETMKVGVGTGFAVAIYGEGAIPDEGIDNNPSNPISLRVLEAFIRPEIDFNLDNGYTISIKTKIAATMNDKTATLALALKDAYIQFDGAFGKLQLGAVKSVANKLHVSSPWASSFAGVDYGYIYPETDILHIEAEEAILEMLIYRILDENAYFVDFESLLPFSSFPDLTSRAVKLNVYTPRFALSDLVAIPDVLGVAVAASYTPKGSGRENVFSFNLTLDGSYDFAMMMPMMDDPSMQDKDMMASTDMMMGNSTLSMVCGDNQDFSYRWNAGYEIATGVVVGLEETGGKLFEDTPDMVADTGLSLSSCGFTLGTGIKYFSRMTPFYILPTEDDFELISKDTTRVESLSWSLGLTYGRDQWKVGFGVLQSRILNVKESDDSIDIVGLGLPVRNNIDFVASYDLGSGLTISGDFQYIWHTEYDKHDALASGIAAGVILGFLY